MKILIIKNHNHYLSGWTNVCNDLNKIIRSSFPHANVKTIDLPYSSWYTSSYYFYTYKNIELDGYYDLIFVCEGRPSKKWIRNGKIIWIPMQEFLKGSAWKIIRDEEWFNILSPSALAYQRINEINPNIPIDHFQFWTEPIVKNIHKNDKLTLLLHFRSRNLGNKFWEKLIRKLNKIDLNLILKIDNHSDLDLSNINLSNIKRIITGVHRDRTSYFNALSSSDIYFSPRIIEGIGLCSQEACSLGNILIFPDFSTTNEYFTEKNGFKLECSTYKDSNFFLGQNINVNISQNQHEIISYIQRVRNNHKLKKEIQEYNFEYAETKFIEFKHNLTQYIDSKITNYIPPRKTKIVHLQFCLEGGQGLISANIAKDLQESYYDNEFYYVTDNENEKAINSYLERLKSCNIKTKKIVSPKEIGKGDIIFIHWCSVANRISEIKEFYRWISKQENTVGLIYDSICTMPQICDYYCVPSLFNTQFVPCNSKKTFIIPYQVEDCFYENYKEIDYLNYKNSQFVIGRTSRLIERKFHKNFIPICKYLSKQKDLSVHLIGDGYYKNNLIKSFERYNLPYRISSGEYSNFRALIMKSFDLCLYLTSTHEESFGLSVAEQMALGIPVICENKGALPEIVGNAGVVCNNFHEIINQTEKLINDYSYRQEISLKCKEKAKEYKRTNIVKKYKSMIDYILNKNQESFSCTNPKWSIIIPCYNCSKYLPTLIQSLKDQTYKDFEVIIVNDGSTEEIPIYEGIKYVHLEGPNSQAYAWKKGVEYASGEFLGFVDADDWLIPGAIELICNNYSDHVCIWSQNEQWSCNLGHKLRDGYSEDPSKYSCLLEGMKKEFPGIVISHFITCRKDAFMKIDFSKAPPTSADRWLGLEMEKLGKLGFVNLKLYRHRFMRKGSTTKEKRELQLRTIQQLISSYERDLPN